MSVIYQPGFLRPAEHLRIARLTAVLMVLHLSLFIHPGFPSPDGTIELQPYHRRIPFTGFTQPIQSMTLSSEVSGRCLRVQADVGDALSASGILAELDTTFIALDLQANRIARDKIQRQLISEKKTLDRYATLHDRKSVPLATLDEVSLNAELHELSLQNLQNEQQRLQERFNRHIIKGPAGWQVIERFAEPGEYVQAGQAVARLGDFRQLLVSLALSFSELRSLQQMDSITMLLPDLEATVEGQLFRIAPDFDRESRKIHVELTIDANQDHINGSLRGGMRVQLHLRSPEGSSAFVVPLRSVVSRYDAHWLVTPDKQRVQVIYLGTTDDGKSAIISGKGLAANDLFLVQPTGDKEK